MNIYRVIVGLLVGAAVTALAALALNLPTLFFVIPAMLLLSPGGFMEGLLLSRHPGMSNTAAVLAFDAISYSAIAYFILKFWIGADSRKLRTAAGVTFVPVLILACLACIPSVSPAWPRGMKQLAEKEEFLTNSLLIGSDLESARSFLKTSGIDAHEQTVAAQEVAFQDSRQRMLAQTGDVVVWARVPTEAAQFPCGFRIDVVLIFNEARKLEQRHIQRFPLCP